MVGADYFMQKATKRMTITRVTVAMYHADAVARCDAADVVRCDAERRRQGARLRRMMDARVTEDRSEVLTFARYPGSELLQAAASG